MVKHNKKPVNLKPVPAGLRDNTLVWHIEKTGEVFNSYQEYKDRMAFYKQNKFSTHGSTQANMNFFEAQEKEHEGAREVEATFPEALKGPVLHFINFNETPRIDTLTDKVFNNFKGDFIPGEEVYFHTRKDERLAGIIRDKMISSRNGESHVRYYISPKLYPDADDVCLEPSELSRDRKVWNKSIIRAFIKKATVRLWSAGPFVVEHEIGRKYDIDLRPPADFDWTKYPGRKVALMADNGGYGVDNDYNGGHDPDKDEIEDHGLDTDELMTMNADNDSIVDDDTFDDDATMVLPSLKPSAQPRKKPMATMSSHEPAPGQFRHNHLPGSALQNHFSLSMQDHHTGGSSHTATDATELDEPEMPLPPREPAPRYPIADLEVEQKKNALVKVRPPLKFLCMDPPAGCKSTEPYSDCIPMSAVHSLLTNWQTLNVYCEVFKLDSFTFDDFVEAMCVDDPNNRVELFDEIHCAAIRLFIFDQNEEGDFIFDLALPKTDETDYSTDPEIKRESSVSTDEMPPKSSPPPPTRRSARKVLAHAEARRIAEENKAPEGDYSPPNNAGVLVEHFNWYAEAKRCNFSHGGWQHITCGLLYRLSYTRVVEGLHNWKWKMRTTSAEVLAHLVPANITDPTREFVRKSYYSLDIGRRMHVLNILVTFATGTEAIRKYMEMCGKEMTNLRKEKTEVQREKKQLIEELRTLVEKKGQLGKKSVNCVPYDDIESDTDAAEEGCVGKGGYAADADKSGSEVELPMPRRHFRVQDAAATKKAREDKKRIDKEKADLDVKTARQKAKLKHEIRMKEEEIRACDEAIATCDEDLRERDCQRTRLLGRDRFRNRYWWFERSGMPYGGLPDSSTAYAGYACGRIWVQGPLDDERKAFIEHGPAQADHRVRFGRTITERKSKEEGKTSLRTEGEWGYIDDPADLELLVQWLDVRGVNESKLRKEICAYKDKILEGMRARRTFLELDSDETGSNVGTASSSKNDKQKENVEPAGKEKKTSSKKRPVAHRSGRVDLPAHSLHEPEMPVFPLRCQMWHNDMARRELGEPHSRPGPKAGPNSPYFKKRMVVRKRRADDDIEPSSSQPKTRRKF